MSIVEQIKLPDGWTIEGCTAFGRFGERKELYSCGKPIGKYVWPLEITVEREPNGYLRVQVKDDNATFTSGSETIAEIPASVLLALGLGEVSI